MYLSISCTSFWCHYIVAFFELFVIHKCFSECAHSMLRKSKVTRWVWKEAQEHLIMYTLICFHLWTSSSSYGGNTLIDFNTCCFSIWQSSLHWTRYQSGGFCNRFHVLTIIKSSDIDSAKVVFMCWPDFLVVNIILDHIQKNNTICYQFLKFVISIQMLELIL